MKEKQFTHDELVERSRSWLSGKGYPIVITEIAAVGEEPDALGFKNGWSTLIECKAHRSDFLSDGKKPWRLRPENALGDDRYYCAPRGLISPDELPTGWGLLETSGRGLRIKVRSSNTSQKKSHRNEIYVLMSVIRRIGQTNPEGVSIRCYTHESKNRASVTIDNATGKGYRGQDIKIAFVSGYEQGHNDTVESCYGSSEEKADDYLEEPENFA